MRMREFGRAARLPVAPQEHRTHVGSHPDARGCDRGLDQVHGVVYGQPCVQRTTWVLMYI
jgi:hypothetical protein